MIIMLSFFIKSFLLIGVTFDNDEVRIYDMSDNLYGVFETLKDKNTFNKVFIDEFGNRGTFSFSYISW